MKKITGKALSLVLSLALVASSFSATFASASTKTVSGSVDLKEDNAKVIYLVSGGQDKSEGVCLTDWINEKAKTDVTMDTPDHEDVTVDQILDVSHVSGDKLVKWGDSDGGSISDDDDEKTYLFLKNKSGEGKEIISVLYKGTYSDDDGNDVNVKARAEITVHVIKEGTIIVGKGYETTADLEARKGLSIEDIDSLAQKTDAALTDPMGNKYVDSSIVGVYVAYDGSDTDDTCLVEYAPAKTYFACATEDNNDAAQSTSGDYTTGEGDGLYTVKVSGSTSSKCDFLPVDGTDNLLNVYSRSGVGTGNMTFTLTNSKNNNSGNKLGKVTVGSYVSTNEYDDSKVTTKVSVVKEALVRSNTSVNKNKKTWLDAAKTIDVTGYDLVLDENLASFTVNEDCVIGKISGGKAATAVDVTSATVDEIDLDDDFAGKVIINDSKVGDVDGAKGSVDISGGSTVGNVEADQTIDVTSGTVGDITSDEADVNISSNDDDTVTSVGKVKADNGIDLDSDDSKVTVKTLFANGDSSTFTVHGDSVTVGSIDMDYRDATLSVADFQGKLPAPVNAKNASIETTDEDADVTFNGAATIDSLDLNDESAVLFDTSLKAETISGSGIVKLPLGSLYVTDTVSGSPILKFTNDFAVGDTAFKADSDAVDEDDFDGFGFTLSKSEGKETDTFKIASAKFAGLLIDPSSARIAKGTQWAQTFKASAYPSGTSIPSGDKIDWDFDGNENNFKFTENADGTATIEVIAVDADFASENEGTLTATLVDENGDEDDDYDATECAVTALAVPDSTFKSDTGAKLDIQQGKTYQFKITSLDGKEPTFGVGSGSLTVTKVGKSGNDYFFKITAVGKVGDEVGVYVNGTRSTVAKITAGSSSIKVDTGAKLTVAKGKTYQFKVTASSKPTFTSGNSAVFTTAVAGQKGNDYFFKVTAVGKSGDCTGIYINGVRYTIATIK
jgi:hypothetical protein